jgi:hypothetical protein
LSETCRVSFQNKFEKLVYLVVFIIRFSLSVVPCLKFELQYVVMLMREATISLAFACTADSL